MKIAQHKLLQMWVRQEFTIDVGLHQGSALSPLLFILIMDVVTDDIEEDTPWAMLFADDIAISDESSQTVGTEA